MVRGEVSEWRLMRIFLFGPRRAHLLSAVLLAAVGLSSCWAVQAQEPVRLVKDINDRIDIDSASIGLIGARADQLYFANYEASVGHELWVTNGTEAGTTLLKDLAPGPDHSYPGDGVTLNGRLFFRAKSLDAGRELWVSDGTAEGTFLFKDIFRGPEGSYPRGLSVCNDKFFFLAEDEESGREIWVSDGSATGTFRVKDIEPGVGPVLPSYPTCSAGSFYFLARESLWVSDGTEAGTRLIVQFGVKELAAWDGQLYLNMNADESGYELWKMDVVDEQLELVKDIAPGSEYSFPNGFFAHAGYLYFQAWDGTHGYELWRTDGTELGTTLVKDVWPGEPSSSPRELAPCGQRLCFTAQTSHSDDAFLTTDGTSIGTDVLLSDTTHAMGVYDGDYIFQFDDGEHGAEVWRSDGTLLGTRMLKDANAGEGGSDPVGGHEVLVTNGLMYFVRNDDVHGDALWVSDGTPEGTARLGGVPGPGVTQSSFPERLTAFDSSSIIFSADDGNSGRELWISDGTFSGTRMVHDIKPGEEGSDPSGLFVQGDRIFFDAGDGSHGRELWLSDGTSSGTRMVADINPFGDGVDRTDIEFVGDWAYFTANDGVSGRELWRSDGTSAGTALVRDIRAGPSSSLVRNLTRYSGRLYFVANDGVHGAELWVSDGTQQGTSMVKDIEPGHQSGSPSQLVLLGGKMYFFAYHNGSSRRVLWVTDGTQEGTEPLDLQDPVFQCGFLPEMTAHEEKLYFGGTSASIPECSLWVSDGTGSGTMVLKEGGEEAWFPGPFSFDDLVYFFWYEPDSEADASPAALWATDGTVEGTKSVLDAGPVYIGSRGHQAVFDGHLYIYAYWYPWADEYGVEPLITDGTRAGTEILADIFPGTMGSSPRFFTATEELLFFGAARHDSGYELWVAERNRLFMDRYEGR